jgi:3D-(3,5/4)-trihydroxycyclohexane-1,2-dione acylhydrolase (decyclizing)
VAHAASMGAIAEKVESLADLEMALERSKKNDRTTVIVIDTDPMRSTDIGGSWWNVAVPEVSPRGTVRAARRKYVRALRNQRVGN